MSCYAQRCYDFSLLLLHLLFSQDSRAKTGQSLVLLGGFRRQEDKLIIPVKKPLLLHYVHVLTYLWFRFYVSVSVLF